MRKRIDYKRVGRQILIFLFILVLGLLNLKAQTVYAEDFSVTPNGAMSSPKWEFNAAHATPEICWVKSHQFECRNMRGEGVWTSSLIDISNLRSVQASVQLMEKGGLDADDYIRVYYNVDGKGEVLFSENGNKEGAFGTAWAQQENLSGNELQIAIHVNNNERGERHLFDNIRVERLPQSNMLAQGYTEEAPETSTSATQLMMFPDPKGGSMKLKFNNPLPKVDVVVYNQHGIVNYNKTFLTQSFSGSVLDVPLRGKLAPGLYYMMVSAGEQDMMVQQIMIQ